jgi:hypothetical protein
VSRRAIAEPKQLVPKHAIRMGFRSLPASLMASAFGAFGRVIRRVRKGNNPPAKIHSQKAETFQTADSLNRDQETRGRS